MLNIKLPLDASHLEDYERDNLLLLRNAVDQAWIEQSLVELGELEGKRVFCGDNSHTWTEKQISKQDAIYALLADKLKKQIIAPLMCVKPGTLTAEAWGNIYEAGEYIGRHQDNDGVIQLMICLENDGQGDEGALGVHTGDEDRLILLNPGDLIVFSANETEHWTIPIGRTIDCPSPRRSFWVCRFYNRQQRIVGTVTALNGFVGKIRGRLKMLFRA